MTCVFEAGYDITIQWFKDDVILYSDTTPYESDKLYNSTLSINSASFESCGEYTSLQEYSIKP